MTVMRSRRSGNGPDAEWPDAEWPDAEWPGISEDSIRARFTVLPLHDVAGVITDANPGDPTIRALDVRVIHAP
jgi:hypothetical protein